MDLNGPVERIPFQDGRGRRIKYRIEDLEVGESRLIAEVATKVRPALSHRVKKLGWTIRTSSEGECTRVWRVA